MRIYKDDDEIGTVEINDGVLEYETDNEALEEVLEWAAVNPVPMASGSVQNGVAYTKTVYVPVDDESFPEALETFIAGYGFVINA
jgi:hypothetical protein